MANPLAATSLLRSACACEGHGVVVSLAPVHARTGERLCVPPATSQSMSIRQDAYACMVWQHIPSRGNRITFGHQAARRTSLASRCENGHSLLSTQFMDLFWAEKPYAQEKIENYTRLTECWWPCAVMMRVTFDSHGFLPASHLLSSAWSRIGATALCMHDASTSRLGNNSLIRLRIAASSQPIVCR